MRIALAPQSLCWQVLCAVLCTELRSLRQGCVCAQIARRVHSLEYVQEHAGQGQGRTRAVRYTPQALAENVYLHPQSALAKAAPEFVVYTQILRTEKRPYLAGLNVQSVRKQVLQAVLSVIVDMITSFLTFVKISISLA